MSFRTFTGLRNNLTKFVQFETTRRIRYRKDRRVRLPLRLESLEERSLLSFGTGGIVTTSVSGWDFALAVAIQPSDQKILAVGATPAPNGAENAFAVARYTTTGSLDTSFSTTGIASTTFNSASTDYGDTADAVVIQGNGAILTGGSALTYNSKLGHYQSTFALARWNSDGTLDKSFGKSGKLTTSFGTNQSNIDSLALTASGQILAMGIDTYNGTRVALARYNTNGSLDTTFGTSGTTLLDVKVAIGSSQYDFSPAAGVLEADGSIMLVGSAGGQVALAHFTANGALDTSFGSGGVVTTSVGGSAGASSVAVQPDGEIVVAGFSDTNLLVIRYNANGTLDPTFGEGQGYVTLANASARGLLVQTNGQIVVAGTSGGADLVARYNADGTPDTAFGTGGIVTTVVPGTASAVANAVAVQADGNIVTAGQGEYFIQGPHGDEQRREIVLVRYNTDGSLDSGSESVTSDALEPDMAALVLDSPDLWDGLGLKKRAS